MRYFLLLALLLASPAAMASGVFGNNKMDDSFSVVSVENGQATLTGTPKSLKAGDTLYFIRSPFQFKVTEVKGDKVTVALPDRHDLAKGAALLRFPTEPIKKGIDTEAKLKRALEE